MSAPTTRDRVVRSQVEPRLAERRRSVAEEQHRRRRRRLAAVLVVLALIGLAGAVAWSPLVDVDRVVVDGAERLDPDLIRSASGIERGEPMVGVDLRAVRRAVRDVPGVTAASVRREWPGTVRIDVVESVGLVRLVSEGRVAVLTTTGALSDPGVLAGAVDELAEVELPPGALGDADRFPDELRGLLGVFAGLPDSLRDPLSDGQLDDRGQLTFDLPGGATLEFGTLDDVPAKLVRTQAAFEQVALECLAVVDVSTARVIVSRVEGVAGCAAPPPTEADGSPAPRTAPPESTTDTDAADADDDGTDTDGTDGTDAATATTGDGPQDGDA